MKYDIEHTQRQTEAGLIDVYTYKATELWIEAHDFADLLSELLEKEGTVFEGMTGERIDYWGYAKDAGIARKDQIPWLREIEDLFSKADARFSDSENEYRLLFDSMHSRQAILEVYPKSMGGIPKDI